MISLIYVKDGTCGHCDGASTHERDQRFAGDEPDLTHGAGYGTAAAIAVSVIWGLSFVAARMALSTLSPVLLATTRFIIASLIFAPVILLEARRGKSPSSGDVKELGVMGLLSISVYFWLQYTGVKYAGAEVSALLVVGLIPFLTGLASKALLRERFGAREALGVALGLGGVALVVLPGLLFESVDWRFYLGVACLLGNAVCWALYSALSRRLIQRIGRPPMVTAYTTVLGTLALIPMSLTSDWGVVYDLQPFQWGSILYLAVVCSGGGYLLWNFALSRTEAVRAAVWLYIEPVAAFVGEALLFCVIPGSMTLLGGAGIILGALLTTFSKK